MKLPWITRFILRYYLLFIILTVAGIVVLKYKPISFFAYFCYFLYVFMFVTGTVLGSVIPIIKLKRIYLNPDKILSILIPMSAISVFVGWLYLIRYFGSLAYIFVSAYAIRSETIGDGVQIAPTIVNYLSAFTAVGFALSLIQYHYTKKRKYVYYCLIFGLLAAASDFQTFGRIGMIFTIFILLGYIIYAKIRIPLKQLGIYSELVFVVLMLPWFIRKGSNLDTALDKFDGCLQYDIPDFLSPLVSVYSYYFSGVYALSELLEKPIMVFFNGQRNFSSFINLFNRLTLDSGDYHRVTIIADPVNIPFETNIFTIIGEAYMDFGLWGIIILPLFWGANFGYLFKYKGLYANALKIVLLAWLFYTPIYNAFSFGGFLLTFIVLLLLTVVSKEKDKSLIRKI